MVTFIVTRSYLIDGDTPTELCSLAAVVSTCARRRNQTGHIIAVRTAYSETDWTLPFDKSIVTVRANEDVHADIAACFTVLASPIPSEIPIRASAAVTGSPNNLRP